VNLCSDGHDEVCFDGRICPVCATIKEKDETIESLQDKVSELQSELEQQ
jgi:hypothetical protein